MVSKVSIKGKTESNPRKSVLQESPPIPIRGICHLGDGCHWSTKLNDTSQETHVITSESHNLFVKTTWASPGIWPQREATRVRSHRGWNFWWLCFSSNIHTSALLLFTHQSLFLGNVVNVHWCLRHNEADAHPWAHQQTFLTCQSIPAPLGLRVGQEEVLSLCARQARQARELTPSSKSDSQPSKRWWINILTSSPLSGKTEAYPVLSPQGSSGKTKTEIDKSAC